MARTLPAVAIVACLGAAACGPKAPRPRPVISNTAEVMTFDAGDALATIRRHVTESAAPTWTVELEPSGRFVRRDSSDKYEEDFNLRDVTEVLYEFIADWEKPHVVRVMLTATSETRYRYGDVDWTSSTDKKVSLAFTNKEAADAVVAALRRLVGSR